MTKQQSNKASRTLSLEELLALSGLEKKEVAVKETVPVEVKVSDSPLERKTCRLSQSIVRRILADKMDSPKVADLSIVYLAMDKTAAEVFYKGIFFYGEIALVEDLHESMKELHISFKMVVPTYSIHMEYRVAVNGKVTQTYPIPVVHDDKPKPQYTVVFKCGEKAWFHDFSTFADLKVYLGKRNYVALANRKDVWTKGGGYFAKIEEYLSTAKKKNYQFKK